MFHPCSQEVFLQHFHTPASKMKKPTTLPPNFVPTKALLNIECPLGEQGRHWMLLASALRNVWNLFNFFLWLEKRFFQNNLHVSPSPRHINLLLVFCCLVTHAMQHFPRFQAISGRPLCQERSKSLNLTPVAHETCPEPEGRNPETDRQPPECGKITSLGILRKKITPECLNPTQSQICPGPICETTPSLSETCETL